MNYMSQVILFFFFFNDTATTEIYTLSLHDALPILASKYSSMSAWKSRCSWLRFVKTSTLKRTRSRRDRKSTRLNSSHLVISYAVFCLKKKKKTDYYHSVSYRYVNMIYV